MRFWVVGAAVMLSCAMAGGQPAAAQGNLTPVERTVAPPLGGARVTGQVASLTSARLNVVLRTGEVVAVDTSSARQLDLVAPVFPGAIVEVEGARSGATMVAMAVRRAKSNPQSWTPDTP